MISALLLFIIFNIINSAVAQDDINKTINCSDIRESFAGSIFDVFKKYQTDNNTNTNFYIVTNNELNPVKVDLDDLSKLQSNFNPANRTCFIIHGFQSSYMKQWVQELSKNLLQKENMNIILVDWKENSNQWNYINAAQSTPIVKKRILNFLESLKSIVDNLSTEAIKIKWNHLYFIGHSLGAHISGQVAYSLKQDDFYIVDRITGLDPAQPCFRLSSSIHKIDKNHAEFVDVIHTQTGNSDKTDAFGLQEPVGHIDFYIDGGTIQAHCLGSFLNIEINRMICSHKIVCEYFIETLSNTGSNKFLGRKWDKTYKHAMQLFNAMKSGEACSDCVEMGINASKNKGSGIYLVFAASDAPYSNLTTTDLSKVEKSIARLKTKYAVFSTSNLPTQRDWSNYEVSFDDIHN